MILTLKKFSNEKYVEERVKELSDAEYKKLLSYISKEECQSKILELLCSDILEKEVEKLKGADCSISRYFFNKNSTEKWDCVISISLWIEDEKFIFEIFKEN